MPCFPGICGQMRGQLLLLEETLRTELAGIWQDPQVRFHMIVHGILVLFGDTTIRADILIGFISQIGHTGLGSHDRVIGRSL
jgi:hypothetical protein